MNPLTRKECISSVKDFSVMMVNPMKIRSFNRLDKTELHGILSRRGNSLKNVMRRVERIVEAVRVQGDKAVIRYTEKYDGVTLSPSTIRVKEREMMEAYEKVPEKFITAIRTAAENIEAYHKRQLATFTFSPAPGIILKQVFRPVECAGIYVPGGRAAYPSTVLMTAIPARIAGVRRIVACTPPSRNGSVTPAILVACKEAGVTDIFRIGGAQAIAAMAYGTGTVPKVDVIVGPGNIYVTSAKLLVSSDVKVDLPAGPSELLVLADKSSNPLFVAADLVSQAEHDPSAAVVLVTTSRSFGERVVKLAYKLASNLPTKDTIVSALNNGWVILVENLDEAVKFINLYAPEHLEIQVENAEYVLEKVRNAGAIFLGKYSPVAVGDYAAGSNHVLPTGGYAKAYSGLSVDCFVKRISVVKCTLSGLKELSEVVSTLAELEGLPAHAESVRVRLNNEKC